MSQGHDIEGLTDLQAQMALSGLNTDFCHHLDHGNVEALLDLFTPDALYTHGPRRSQGREEIAQVFQRRSAKGVRTSRHVQSGLRISLDGPNLASGSSVCVTYAANAEPPIQGTAPVLVADFADRYRLCPDGRWRISERHIRRIFEEPGSAGPVGMTAAETPGEST